MLGLMWFCVEGDMCGWISGLDVVIGTGTFICCQACNCPIGGNDGICLISLSALNYNVVPFRMLSLAE